LVINENRKSENKTKKSQLQFNSNKEKPLIYTTQACAAYSIIQGVLFLIVNKMNIVEFTFTKDSDVFHQRNRRD